MTVEDGLKFEFGIRWREVGGLLLPQSTAEQQTAFSLLERKDRELEEYLNTLSFASAGGGSIIDSVSDVQDWSNSGPVEHTHSVTLTVPDTDDQFYVFWEINGRAIQNLEAGASASMSGWAWISEQAAGVGFETAWGYGDSIQTSVDWESFGGGNEFNAPQLGGHASRIETLNTAINGSDIHINHHVVYETTSGPFSHDQYLKGNLNVLLFTH